MHGLVIAVICLGILWALIVSRGFRITVGLLIAAVIVWALIESDKAEKQSAANAIVTEERESHEKARQAELWSKVRPEQVELRNPQLAPDSFSSDRFKLSASIMDLSNQQLGGFEIEVTARDCADRCEIIGHSADIMWVDVPPQQVRGISGVVILPNLPQHRGESTPQFVVKRVYAGDMLDSWNVSKN